MNHYTIVKDETSVNSKNFVSLNEFYKTCDMCFYVLPVQETDDLNYTIVDDHEDVYFNISNV